MKKLIYILSILILGIACRKKTFKEPEQLRVRYVEDIQFDINIDDPHFSTCNGDNHIIQYFNNSEAIEFEGGKRAIIDIFKQDYVPPKNSKFTGLIRIRFIVDCEGNTGRFRVLSMNYDYKKVDAPQEITDQLMSITKRLNGWRTKTLNDISHDYYQYLSFKIVIGEIEKILP